LAVCNHEHYSKVKISGAYLERYVLAAQSDLQLLATVFVLLRPLCVIFSVVNSQCMFGSRSHVVTYLSISLSLTMRLISDTKASLTHTAHISTIKGCSVVHPYSLFGSGNRCGSWSCSHIGRKRCVHLRAHESRTLYSNERLLIDSTCRSLTEEFVAETSLVTRAAHG
jgi:hypothetical protein